MPGVRRGYVLCRRRHTMNHSRSAPGSRLTMAILAGGQSRRMGTDKALVELGGKPLIAHVVERLQPLNADETIIICRDQARYAFLGLATVEDITPDLGPIGGLFTALTLARNANVILVGCDMPFASSEVMATLLDTQHRADDVYDALIPTWEGRPQPLHALYHVGCLAKVERAIEVGERAMVRLLASLNTYRLSEQETAHLDPTGKAFTNLNTPEEVRAIQTHTMDGPKEGEACLAPT